MKTSERNTKVGRVRAGAFTLIELLVVIAIVAILVAIITPALSRARMLSKQTRELKTSGSLMTAYVLYAQDHKGLLMPGYASSAMTQPPGPGAKVMDVRDERGSPIYGQVARRYPWRIAPYLSYNFAGLYDDLNLLERYQARTDYQYVVSLSPSLGVNAEFVGGKGDPGLGFNDDALALYGPFYVTRLDQPRRPSGLLVFASTRGVDPDGASPVPGFHLAEAPGTNVRRWSAGAFDATKPPESWGYLDPRFGGKVVTGWFDGRSAVSSIDDLRDMRAWADRATKADWVLGAP